ncbi:replication protein RepA [Hyphomicrobium sp. NDB2Meth4]|uniref:replication protein RepA n=1 Tax=Hyphomicrobium sp. NDB2Meth4 TaxID=1892846 RepID=UPI000AF52DF4|nr:replication protein RepA [Hyphomicrobium sp. NDB2Meth4]
MPSSPLPLFTEEHDTGQGAPAPAVVHAEIRDTDLLARLAAADVFSRGFTERSCIAEQARRDALAAMSPAQRRRAIAQHELSSQEELSRDNVGHIHSVLAICSLPYVRQPDSVREWNREQGKMRLSISAGKLLTPDGEWEQQPIPYGAKARLLMIHLCSEAVLNGSPNIDVNSSMTAFVRSLGFNPTGGKNGTLTAFRQQMKALAACHMTIGTYNGDASKTINASPFSSMELWKPRGKNGQTEVVTLDDKFYRTLTKHALPVNMRAVRIFANSPRKLDIMCWIGHRIHCLDDSFTLGWEHLFQQFGEGYNRFGNFKRDFPEELKEIKEVFPKLPIKITEKGAVISPAGPDVLYLPKPKPKKVKT